MTKIERVARAMMPHAWEPAVDRPESSLKPEVRERHNERLRSIVLEMASAAVTEMERGQD